MNQNDYVVIIAGGVGSRFWPESRQSLPKQFLDILNSGKSLLQATYQRFEGMVPPQNIFVITHEHYVEMVQQHLPDLPAANIVGEPSRKNTAAAAAYMNFKIASMHPDANILLSPADHLVTGELAFSKLAMQAFEFVRKRDAIVTLGVQPTRPDTGYGYIQYDDSDSNGSIRKVKTFTEKPSLDIARSFLKSGDFLWNSGIFIWNAANFSKTIQAFLPEMYDVFLRSVPALNTDKEKEVIKKVYSQCTNISIDYGIMEKAANVYVIPGQFGWSDLGTWESAYEHAHKEDYHNAIMGNTIMMVESTNNFVKVPKNKLAVVQGLDGYIIIDTPEILLICERSKEQHIKQYVAEVKHHLGDTYL